MDFGIGIATSHDSWKLAQRAEELGFTHAWFYDTQMITADCFVAMGAAAMKTSRIRLGTGVLVPSNRIAAVTANAFATLNGMAPGRIDFGVGTGFSARRAMGLGAMKLADMEEYIRVVYGLLNGETLETNIEGKRKKIRFLNPDAGLINTHDPIRLHVSAYGPKSQALTAKLNAGWKSFISDVPGAMTALEGMRQSWAAAGRSRRRPLRHRLGVRLRAGAAASRPTARAPSRRPARAPRCCCIARPMSTWRAGRTPRRCPQSVQATGRRLRRDGARLRAAGRALSEQPPRPFRLRQAGGEEIRHRRADPPHHVHRHRAGIEAAHRGVAQTPAGTSSSSRSPPARSAPSRTGRGSSARSTDCVKIFALGEWRYPARRDRAYRARGIQPTTEDSTRLATPQERPPTAPPPPRFRRRQFLRQRALAADAVSLVRLQRIRTGAGGDGEVVQRREGLRFCRADRRLGRRVPARQHAAGRRRPDRQSRRDAADPRRPGTEGDARSIRWSRSTRAPRPRRARRAPAGRLPAAPAAQLRRTAAAAGRSRARRSRRWAR